MKKASVLMAALLSAAAVFAANPHEVRFHNEASDTARISELLVEGMRSLPADASPGDRADFFARRFIGTPYGAHTLEAPVGQDEALVVNLDSLDCTTFVETVAALAATLGEGRSSWRDYLYNLRRIRYRGGELDGYPSRLHYIADWAVDNIHKGILRDATLLMPRNSWMVRSIDFMTAHRDSYPALADSATFQRMRRIEFGYRNHRFPYLRTGDLTDRKLLAAIQPGDIVAFVSTLKDLDVTHMGIIVRGDDGSLRVLHASSTGGKVMISEQKLSDFMKRNRQWSGIRLFRLR